MEQEHMFNGTGWGAVRHDLSGAPQPYTTQKSLDQEDDDSAPNSPAAGAGPPPDLVAAFLQSHKGNDPAHEAAAAGSKVPPVLRSSSINSDADGEALLLPNPFAVTNGHINIQHYPTVPTNDAPGPQQQQQQHAGLKGAIAPSHHHQQQQQQGRKQRTFLQRLRRWFVITSASAGLMALGAWGGSLAYRHYMAQLDDRDQLARQVTNLQKQEEKLVLRCTALEQDRQYLTQQLSDASTALNEGAAARSRLQQQLAQSTGDREEAVRLNLNLQRKLSTLEEQHASLSASHKERGQALDATLAEGARLDREVTKLMGSVEKLESRCGALEAANVELKKENAALIAAQQKQQKQQKARQ